jgi:hypothetical protein
MATTYLDPVASCGGSFLTIGIRAIREEGLQKSILTTRHEVQEVLDKGILVLVRHAGDIVHHVSGIMPDQELRAAGLKVRIGGQRGCTLNEAAVCGRWVRVCSRASVVESGEDSRGAFLFNEVAHDLVVEVLDRRPFDLLSDVFFLFRFQRELDEDLLQFLIDVVNAELFEGIVLKNGKVPEMGASQLHRPRRFRTRRYPCDDLSSHNKKHDNELTRIPMTCAVEERGFMDMFTLDTIHSNKLL